MNLFFQFVFDEKGQDLIEYTLLMTFIAIACLALISSGHPATQAVWQTANNVISVANTLVVGH